MDDEYLVRYGLRETIPWQALGVEIVAEAADGWSGWEEVMAHRPELVITDIKMPVADGIEMMRMVQEQGVRTKFIVLSGYDDFEYAKHAMKYGTIDYILKPVENDKLIEAIVRMKEQVEKEQIIHRLGKEKLLAELVGMLKMIRTQKTALTSATVNDILAYIHAHYSDCNLTIHDIAEHLQISVSYLMHIFKEEMEMTVIDYLVGYRLDCSTKYLLTQQYKVYEVARMVGYSDYRYYSSIFKKRMGYTPRSYVKKVLSK